MNFSFFNFKRKTIPEFWTHYCDLFKQEKKQSIKDTRFVVLDTETTGFDFKKDRILCIGAIAVQGNKILVKDSLEIYLSQEIFNPKTVQIHGILKSEKTKKLKT